MTNKDASPPALIRAREQCAEQAELGKEYHQASEIWRKLTQETGRPVHARRHVQCLVQASELAKAAEYSCGYKHRWPRIPVFVGILLQHAYRQQASESVALLWAQLAANAGDNSKPALVLIRRLLHMQDYPGALHAVEQAFHFWQEDDQVRQRYYELTYRYGKDTTQPPPLALPNLEAPGLTASAAMLTIRQYADEASSECVVPLLKSFLERWPDNVPAIRLLLRSWQRESAYEAVLDYCQRRFASKRRYEAFILQHWVPALVALGQVGQAVALLQEAQPEGRLDRVIQQLLISSIGEGLCSNNEMRAGLEALCRLHGIEGIAQAMAFEAQLNPPQRPLIPTFDATDMVVASPKLPASCLAIVFTGFARRVGAVPQALLDRFFAGHGIAMVRLVDSRGHLYLEGIPELGGSFEATVDALRRMAEVYSAKRIITIGNSGGGMGALRYGAALNASHVLAFSPAVNLDLEFLEATSDYRARAVIRKLNRLFTPETLDVRHFIKSTDMTGRMDVYAGAQSLEDQCQIHHLAGLNNVHLHAIEGVNEHESIGPAVLDGTLLAALKRVVS